MWPFRSQTQRKLDLLFAQQEKTMSMIDDLKAAEAAEATKIDALLAFAAQQRDLIVQLQAKIDAGGDVSQLQGVLDDMKAKAGAIDAFLAPPVPPVAG